MAYSKQFLAAHEFRIGSVWRPADGTNHLATVIGVDVPSQDVKYVDSSDGVTRVADAWAFQVRHCDPKNPKFILLSMEKPHKGPGFPPGAEAVPGAAWATRAEAVRGQDEMGHDGKLDWRVGPLFQLKGDSRYLLLWNNHLSQEVKFGRAQAMEMD